MRKDRYSRFLKISRTLLTSICHGNYNEAKEVLQNCSAMNFDIKDLLRFQIDHYDEESLIRFCEDVSLDVREIEQYKIYFAERRRVSTIKCCVPRYFGFLELLGRVINDIENNDNPEMIEVYIAYLNFVILEYQNVDAKSPFLPLNKDKQYQNSMQAYMERYIAAEALNAFRLNFCDIISDTNGITKFLPKKIIQKIQLRNKDAGVKLQLYSMLYSKIEDSTLSDFVDDALIWLRSLYTLRKWFEFEEYKIHGIVLTSWLKVFLVLFYENYSAYLKGDRIVRKYYKEWMDSFAHIDVCESDIETIFGYLVINYKEMPKQDLQFDCRDKPILYFNNCYYTFPAVILSSDIINALLFQAKGKNETSKRGDTYEDVTREKWGKILGKVITIEESGPDGQYQCDMAFVFDECLFVCELKNEAQPYSYDEWKRFQVRTEENKEN